MKNNILMRKDTKILVKKSKRACCYVAWKDNALNTLKKP